MGIKYIFDENTLASRGELNEKAYKYIFTSWAYRGRPSL